MRVQERHHGMRPEGGARYQRVVSLRDCPKLAQRSSVIPATSRVDNGGRCNCSATVPQQSHKQISAARGELILSMRCRPGTQSLSLPARFPCSTHLGGRSLANYASVGRLRLRLISSRAWSSSIAFSQEAFALSYARMSCRSSNSSRSFLYSSISMTTASLSPFSLVRNRVGALIASPLQKVYSARQAEPITKKPTTEIHSLFVAGGGYFQDGEEGFLRDIYLAYALHALFAFFLFFEELAFAGDVAAVALGQNVFANRGDGFAGDYAAANRGLNGDLEHLPRNQFSQAGNQIAPAVVGLFAMANHGKRVHRLAAHQNIELDQIRFAVAREVIIERSVAS